MVEFIKDFFGTFQSIVYNVNQYGPIALGILLLCVTMLACYVLKDFIKTNVYAQIVCGVLAVVVVGFMGVSFIYGLNQSDIPKNFLRGKFTYQIPPPLQAGDLDIRLRGDSRSGESQGIYEYTLDSRDEKLIFSISKHDSIAITIRNRPLFRECDVEYQGKLGTRSPSYRTQYEITLDGAYLPARDYFIGFEYERIVDKKGNAHDVLMLTDFTNIDATKIKTKVRHTPDNCVGIEDLKLIKIQMTGSPASNGTTRWATGLIAPSAKAADDRNADLLKRLRSSQRSLSTRAKAQISENPAAYLDLINLLFQSDNSDDVQALVNVLGALQDASPNPYRLADDRIRDLFRFSHSGSQPIRLAARDYLRNTGIVDAGIIKLATSYLAEIGPSLKGKSLAGTSSDQYYLLLVTVRDTYYNAGIKYIVDYRGDYGQRERNPKAINDALAAFAQGVGLISLASAGQKASFGKAYYGKALALFSRAVVKEAEGALGANAKSNQIQEYITAQDGKNAPLKLSESEHAEFSNTIDRFFETIAGYEDQYFWQHHIKQLKNCRDQLIYSCFKMDS